jgi:CheY-like chemotaxis protein/DNA-binding XRE family transcriptional regulator
MDDRRQPAHAFSKPADEPAPSSVPLSIAALDDDADFREYLATVLAPDGHALRAYATPGELLAGCEISLPDLVLLDMKMGEHTGEGVLAELRERWPRLCIIVVTGYPSLDSMRQTFRQQVFDYVAKPFSPAELRRVLAQAAAELGLGRRPQDRLRLELGRQIRLSRTERGWTLKDLSEASGISVSQLSSIERGAHLPSVESLLTVALALGRTPSLWLSAAGF